MPSKQFKYDLVESLKNMPARLHVLDLLQMSKETCDNFIRELQSLDPNIQVNVAEVHQKHQIAKSKRPQKQFEECFSIQKVSKAIISFSKEDLLLCEAKHTGPLYLTTYIKDIPIPRVQVDPRSALNLITITALQKLGIQPSELTSTNTSIQGYDGEV